MEKSNLIRTTFEDINEELKPLGAKISIKNKCLQPKSAGYCGEAFADSKKPVYDFDIVDARGLSFANTKSALYRMAGGQTHPIIKRIMFGGYYIETARAIYL